MSQLLCTSSDSQFQFNYYSQPTYTLFLAAQSPCPHIWWQLCGTSPDSCTVEHTMILFMSTHFGPSLKPTIEGPPTSLTVIPTMSDSNRLPLTETTKTQAPLLHTPTKTGALPTATDLASILVLCAVCCLTPNAEKKIHRSAANPRSQRGAQTLDNWNLSAQRNASSDGQVDGTT